MTTVQNGVLKELKKKELPLAILATWWQAADNELRRFFALSPPSLNRSLRLAAIFWESALPFDSAACLIMPTFLPRVGCRIRKSRRRLNNIKNCFKAREFTLEYPILDQGRTD